MAGIEATLSVVKLLRHYGADYTRTNALHYAAEGTKPGRLKVMAYLIHEVGFLINQLELEYFPIVYRDYFRNVLGTALHSAVKRKFEKTVKFLLENGADRNKEDTDGLKPIDLARQYDFEAGIQLLQHCLVKCPAKGQLLVL